MAPTVSVLLPVRNEAARVRPCLEGLLAQECDGVEVLVLDDRSADGTAEVVRDVVRGDDRVRVLPGGEPPAGWLGKPHACAQLAAEAGGDVLVFLDADVVLQPGGLAGAVAALNDLDLVSPYPRQAAPFALARLVQPLLQWSWLTFLPLRLAERTAAPSLTAANGQLLACRAASYRLAGGHAAVRAEVLEDVALARAFKHAGLRVGMADGTHLATCRMYEGPRELADGYGKSLWAAFGSRRGGLMAAALLAWLYLLPPGAVAAGVLRRDPLLGVLGGLGYGAAVAGRVAIARRTGSPPADGLAHPLSIVALLALLARSWRLRKAGSLVWRGRPVAV